MNRRIANLTETPENILTVQKLHKRYSKTTWANQDINLTVNKGEILGILGPNGAGKTTLVRQITTELLPTSGEIRILGIDVLKQPISAKLVMGVVPQEAHLLEYLTPYQHLRIFGKLRGLTPKVASQRALELLDELKLNEFHDIAIDHLSGGLRRRLLIGIAALATPPLLILDEPTTGLDPQARRSLWSLLKEYQARGSGILITTHYMEEAEELCDRVAFINNGRIIAIDSVNNLRAEQGFDYKVTYITKLHPAEPRVRYGNDTKQLSDQAIADGAQQFSINQANLEDVYLALINENRGSDE